MCDPLLPSVHAGILLAVVTQVLIILADYGWDFTPVSSSLRYFVAEYQRVQGQILSNSSGMISISCLSTKISHVVSHLGNLSRETTMENHDVWISVRLDDGCGFIHGFPHRNPQGYGYGYRIGQNPPTHIHIHTHGKAQKPVGKPLVADISPGFPPLAALNGNKCWLSVAFASCVSI